MSDKIKNQKLKVKTGFNPKQFVELNPILSTDKKMFVKEEKSNTAVITFGRFSPPTIGHEKLVRSIVSKAKSVEGTPLVFLSHTQDSSKNPLSYIDKLVYMKKAFGAIVQNSAARTIVDILKQLSEKYENVVLVVGSDRVAEFTKLLNSYNGKEFNFKKVEVVSAGQRDPDSDEVSEGISASKMRQFAKESNFEAFKGGLPSKLQPLAKEVYSAILKGMKLMEELNEEQLDEKIHPLTFQERRRRSLTMRRFSRKMELAKERAEKRRASPEKLKSRARKKAIAIIRARILKDKSYGDLSIPEKMALDKRLTNIPDTTVARIAQRQLPGVKKAESERFNSLLHHSNYTSKHEEVDINVMFENFIEQSNFDGHGLTEASNSYKSTSLKRPHRLFNNDGKVHFDKRFKMFKPKQTNEGLEDLFGLIESVEEVIGEGLHSQRASNLIQAEKEADSVRHARMMDTAKHADKRTTKSPSYASKSSPYKKVKRSFSYRAESKSPISQIISIEKNHRKIIGAVKELNKKIGISKDNDKEKMVQIASNVIEKSNIDGFTPRDLLDLHYQIKNAKTYRKKWSAVDAWESYDPATNTPSDREWGTDSLTKTYKKATPGESIKEEKKGLWHNIHQRRKRGLRPLRPGEKGYPKTLDIEETVTGGFEGKVRVPNVKVRMVDGSIKSMPAPKSASSKDGGGD